MADSTTLSLGAQAVGPDQAPEALDPIAQDAARQALARQHYQEVSAETRLAKEAGLEPTGEVGAAALNLPDRVPEQQAAAQFSRGTTEDRELRTRITARQPAASGGLAEQAGQKVASNIKRRILLAVALSPVTWGIVILLGIVFTVAVVFSQPQRLEQGIQLFGKDFIQPFAPAQSPEDSGQGTTGAPGATQTPQSGSTDSGSSPGSDFNDAGGSVPGLPGSGDVQA